MGNVLVQSEDPFAIWNSDTYDIVKVLFKIDILVLYIWNIYFVEGNNTA